jgi:transmembrane sensor
MMMRNRCIGWVAALAVGVGAYLFVHSLQVPMPTRTQLADGTVAISRADSRIESAPGFPHPRSVQINGDLYLEVPARTEPLTVTSRLLILTVNGKSALRITAYAGETGEQVQVVYGDVVARKHYASSYPEPDHLVRGEMSMVNQTIDLMEKETFDPAEANAWVKQLR